MINIINKYHSFSLTWNLESLRIKYNNKKVVLIYQEMCFQEVTLMSKINIIDISIYYI